ncbi:hypothetical protein B0H63DRAFT_447702 [Podospora didyma]|uniref:FAD-binding PCMH-type domain-containing protein n=1 Tax=Podospora didyma TaxID=330526 RepID=A0AAE0U0T8_9PEZI|nr:hypothetical protein B0H63DRAFT_447702 [Podospora didyma]
MKLGTALSSTWAMAQTVSVLASQEGYPPRPSPDAVCRAAPGSADWPSQRQWARLNETLDGRLVAPVPPGAVCHAGWPTYSPDQCPAVQAAWLRYTFHDASLVSTYQSQFSNDTCLPDPKYPCSAAGYPDYVINATSAQHVKIGLEFGQPQDMTILRRLSELARKNHVRLVVRGSGCDFIGRSNAPNSLSISTRNIKGIVFNPTSFRPRGCRLGIVGPSITAGGGSQMAELYLATDKHGQTIVGAGGDTVGLGGYITGGGHGLLAPRYGLAADNVLEMEVVTPHGDIVVANECQNQDLFWAMRGGGGSTFGVMTSVTMRTFPTPPIVYMTAAIITNASDDSIFDAATYVVSQFPYLEAQGVSGYSFLQTDTADPFDPSGSGPRVNLYLLAMALQDTQEAAAVDAVWNPVFAHVNATWPRMSVVKMVRAYPSFAAWYAANNDTNPTGADHWSGSRLVDAATLQGNAAGGLPALRDALRAMAQGSGYVLPFLLSGKGVWNATPRGGGDSAVPAWRKALAHITTGLDFEPLNTTARAISTAMMDKKLGPIRALTPHMGAYMNEVYNFEPDFQRQFWGDNYPRLLRIKRELDPDDVLWCTPCVGNERWQEAEGRLCRVWVRSGTEGK